MYLLASSSPPGYENLRVETLTQLDFASPMLNTGPDLWQQRIKKFSSGTERIFRDTEISVSSQRMRENSPVSFLAKGPD